MLPDRLYEALPFLYLLMGILGAMTSMAAESIMGFACAATLVGAALHIFKLRRQYRRIN